MALIELTFKGLKVKFEKSDEDVNKIFQHLSGGRIIENPIQMPDKSITEKKINSDGKEISYYRPTTKEIRSFILSKPQYRHSTNSIISYYNEEPFVLNPDQPENRNTWYSVNGRMKRIQKSIEKTESGEWRETRIGKAKEYCFMKE